MVREQGCRLVGVREGLQVQWVLREASAGMVSVERESYRCSAFQKRWVVRHKCGISRWQEMVGCRYGAGGRRGGWRRVRWGLLASMRGCGMILGGTD